MLKIGVIGCGKMGLHHIRAIQMQPSVQIVGVADPLFNGENLKEILPDNTPVFHDADTLLVETHPDVVHITTPPETHATLSKLALQYNAHVYVEKPFVPTEAEALELVELAEQTKRKLCPGHQVLYQKPALDARHSLHTIGNIVHIESYFSFRTVRKNITSVEQLIDILPHPVYILLNFLRSSQNQRPDLNLVGIDVRSSGEIRALLRAGDISAVLIVTLQGRPVESYLRIVGTNGSILADFVRGTVVKLLGPGASVFSVLMNPYSEAWQVFARSTVSFARLIFQRRKSYPGLAELIHAFYSSIESGSPTPFSKDSIIDTVKVCEWITGNLRAAEQEQESKARQTLLFEEQRLHISKGTKPVLVTGGTGFLGRVVVKKLRTAGWPVRVIARRELPYSMRIAGVEYVTVDLAQEIPLHFLKDIDTIIHCAAETAGGKELHDRNTIASTHNILRAAAESGVTKLIHTSSLAVLKPSREIKGPLAENSPVDIDNPSRGPYVAAKVESEHMAGELGKEWGIEVRTIRLGPLVDFEEFQAPGRLGREVGRFYIVMGGCRTPLSVCDVGTAAEVILNYVADFDHAPELLNLVEPVAPSRLDLVNRLKAVRPDLRFIWIPTVIIRLVSPILKLAQKLILPGQTPLDIQAAFSSEPYQTDLAMAVTKRAREARNSALTWKDNSLTASG